MAGLCHYGCRKRLNDILVSYTENIFLFLNAFTAVSYQKGEASTEQQAGEKKNIQCFWNGTRKLRTR